MWTCHERWTVLHLVKVYLHHPHLVNSLFKQPLSWEFRPYLKILQLVIYVQCLCSVPVISPTLAGNVFTFLTFPQNMLYLVHITCFLPELLSFFQSKLVTGCCNGVPIFVTVTPAFILRRLLRRQFPAMFVATETGI